MKIKTIFNNFKSLFTKDINISSDPFAFYSNYAEDGSGNKPYKKNSSVYSAVNAIVDNINQADIGFFDFETNKEIWPVELRKLFKKPNPVMSTANFIEAITMFFCLYNEVIIVKTCNTIGALAGTQLPTELWPMNPRKFTVINTDKNNPIWQCNGQTFTRDEIIYIGKFNPYSDNGRPFKPTDPIQMDLDIDYQRLAYNANFFKNGGKPGYIMSTDKQLSEPARAQLHSDWEKNFKGINKAGRLAIFDNGVKFEDTGNTSHSDMQFQEQRINDKETVLGIFRVPKVILSMTDNIQYATFNGQMKAFWLYTISPQLKRIASEFNSQLIDKYNPNIEMRFKYENVPVFKEEFKETLDMADKAMKMGVPFNQVNDKFNLGFTPQPWGNEYWMSMAVIPASQYEEYSSFGLPAADNTISSNDDKQHQIVFGKDSRDKYDKKIADMFLKRHGHFELAFYPKIKSFFYNERSRMLELAAKNEFNVHTYLWQDDKRKILTIAKPMIETILKDGIAFGQILVPSGKSMTITKLTEEEINRNVNVRAMNIVGIVDTIAIQMKKRIEEAILNGESMPSISDIIRDTLNVATARAMTIARTETTGAMNNGTFIYWNDLNLWGKRWLAYNDEFTRDSHEELNGESIAMNEKFSNGLMYPGDQGLGRSADTAKEVINCRCDLAPVQRKPE